MRFLAAAAIVLLGASSAEAGEVSVTVGGTDFNGGPAFEVFIGDALVGKGALDPVPAAGTGTNFVFDVPDAILSAGGDLRIRMTNDAFKSGVGDRNLQVLAATVDGRPVDAAAFQVFRNGEAVERRRPGDLWNNSDVAIATAPVEGWVSATAATQATSAAASEAPPAETAVACKEGSVALLFAENETTLSRKNQALLAETAKAIDGTDCRLAITGYSGTKGTAAVNQRVAGSRAQAVASFLTQRGIATEAGAVRGYGETRRFGLGDAANRRVVVEFAPPNG